MISAAKLKRIFKQVLILSGLLFATSFSQAVSRVGGGTLMLETDLAELSLPPKFPSARQVSADGFQLTGPTLIMGHGFGGGFQTQIISFGTLSTQYPELAGADRSQFASEFLTNGWTQVGVANPCVDAYWVETASAISLVSGWGGGRGFVAIGTKSNDTRESMLDLLNSVKLNAGACAWK